MYKEVFTILSMNLNGSELKLCIGRFAPQNCQLESIRKQ